MTLGAIAGYFFNKSENHGVCFVFYVHDWFTPVGGGHPDNYTVWVGPKPSGSQYKYKKVSNLPQVETHPITGENLGPGNAASSIRMVTSHFVGYSTLDSNKCAQWNDFPDYWASVAYVRY